MQEQQRELDDACSQIEQERTKLERELEHCRDGGHARTIAYDVNQRIVKDAPSPHSYHT